MKRIFLLLFTLAIFTTAIAGAFFDLFQAKAEGDNIKIEWKTGDENNVKNFTVERKTLQGDFIQLTIINAKGSNSYYSYLDENIYKSNGEIFVYRIKITDNDGSISYSKEINVSHNVSGVKRTWGSIKAMFR